MIELKLILNNEQDVKNAIDLFLNKSIDKAKIGEQYRYSMLRNENSINITCTSAVDGSIEFFLNIPIRVWNVHIVNSIKEQILYTKIKLDME